MWIMRFLRRLLRRFKRIFMRKAYKKAEQRVSASQEAPEQPATDEQSLNYHVSRDNDENSEHYEMWRVRKENSDKTMQFFKTQAEAAEYAKNLADDTGASVIIHKPDGTIRDQISKKNS